MRKLFSLVLIFTLIFGVTSCSGDKKEKTTEETTTGGMYDDYDIAKNAGEVVLSPEFNPDVKGVKYKKLPNFGYKDGLDYYFTFTNSSLGEPEDDYKADKNGRGIYGKLHIDGKYVFDNGDAGLCFDYDNFSEEYIDNYNKATKRAGDFIVTDFQDGICINEYIYDEKKVKDNNLIINIPETINGKKVLKLGGACKKVWQNDISFDYEFVETGFLLNVSNPYLNITVKIPKTLRDISYATLRNFFEDDFSYYTDDPEEVKNAKKYEGANISKFVVDKDNQYYYSDNGSLYTKNKKWLLFVGANLKKLVIPETVEYISEEAFQNYNYEDNITITIGENVKKIYGLLYYSDAKIKYKVKKNSYADKYLHSGENNKKVDNYIEYIK